MRAALAPVLLLVTLSSLAFAGRPHTNRKHQDLAPGRLSSTHLAADVVHKVPESIAELHEADARLRRESANVEVRQFAQAVSASNLTETDIQHLDRKQDVRSARLFAEAVNASNLTEVPLLRSPHNSSHGHHNVNMSALQVASSERKATQRQNVSKEVHHKVKGVNSKSTLANEVITFSGAGGINGAAINGRYIGTGNLYNGKPLYQKENDPDRWLRYVTATGLNQWRISSTAGLSANDDKGYLYSLETGLDDPSRATTWYVWDGSQWSMMESIQVTMSLLHPEGASAVAPAAPVSNDATAPKEGGFLASVTAAVSWVFWHLVGLFAIFIGCCLLYAAHVHRRDGRNLLPVWAASLDMPGKIRRLSDVVRSLPEAWSEASTTNRAGGART